MLDLIGVLGSGRIIAYGLDFAEGGEAGWCASSIDMSSSRWGEGTVSYDRCEFS